MNECVESIKTPPGVGWVKEVRGGQGRVETQITLLKKCVILLREHDKKHEIAFPPIVKNNNFNWFSCAPF